MIHYHWDEFQTLVFHVVPSMDLIVLVVNLYGQKTRYRNADQSAKNGNSTMNG